MKVDFDNTSITLEGATVNIKGTSDFGTEYDLSLQSDESGIIHVENMEKGTYVFTETLAPQKENISYAVDSTKRIMTIADDGTVKITGLKRHFLPGQGYLDMFALKNEKLPERDIVIYKT